MSSLFIICVDGVLTAHNEPPPNGSPVLHVLQLVKKISESWQIGYVSSAPPVVVSAWLREIDAPTGVWCIQAAGDGRVRAILRQLSSRADRARFVMAADVTGLTGLAERGASIIIMAHSDMYALGDWRHATTWQYNDDEEDKDVAADA